jgi:hypothetical protein
MISDNEQSRLPSEESRQAGYEVSHLNVRGVAVGLVMFVIIGAMIHVLCYFFLENCVWVDGIDDRATAALTNSALVPQASPNQREPAVQTKLPLPPSPRLQPTPGGKEQNVPRFDLSEMHEKENQIFERLQKSK